MDFLSYLTGLTFALGGSEPVKGEKGTFFIFNTALIYKIKEFHPINGMKLCMFERICSAQKEILQNYISSIDNPL